MSSLGTNSIKVLRLQQHELNQRAACLTKEWLQKKILFSCKAGVYILPLECSLLFKVFYLVSCDHQKLWEDTVAYKYSHGALAEDKTTSQKKESPQKHSTRADFCLSSSSLLLASVCVCEILTMDCGEKQSEDGWMDVWSCWIQQSIVIQTIFF